MKITQYVKITENLANCEQLNHIHKKGFDRFCIDKSLQKCMEAQFEAGEYVVCHEFVRTNSRI